MNCKDCLYWITREVNHYSDDTEKELFKAEEGHGKCLSLMLSTTADFGCNKFRKGENHTLAHIKEGAQWQTWKFGPCPECDGRGCHIVEMRPACRRCAGLGKVRYYDDGYIADASWDHPKEKELKKKQAIDPGLLGITLAPAKKPSGVVDGDVYSE